MDTFNEAARRQRAAQLLVKEAAVEFDAAARLRGQAPPVDVIDAVQEQLAGGLSAKTRDRSAAIADRYGIQPSLRDSFLIELPSTRDMTVAGVSGSAYLVGQSNPGGRFLESLLGASIAGRLGVQTIEMGREDAAVPVVTTAPTTMYLSDETTQISTAQPVIGSRIARPKAVAALVTFTRQLLTMSSPNVQDFLMTEIGRAVAAAWDSALFNGSGVSGQPPGILATPGIVSASGGSIDLADVADMIEDVITAGAPMVSPGFACDGPTLEILLSKYPPAEPGALVCEPLEAAGGVANAAPRGSRHLSVPPYRQSPNCSNRSSSFSASRNSRERPLPASGVLSS